MTLSNKEASRLSRAMKLASMSEARQKHGAAIYIGGSLQAVGVNVVKNDVEIIGIDAKNPNYHAETMAIRACGPDADLSNAVLYVARINRKGLPLNSKPCPSCQEAIFKAGIKRVVHT